MIQAAKIIEIRLATTGLIRAGVGIGVVLYYLLKLLVYFVYFYGFIFTLFITF